MRPASFGELLKHFRIAAGLSQEALAERAHMSAHAISSLERGARRAPYRETVALLQEALGLEDSDRAMFVASDADHFPQNNLPAPITSFVGRERNVAELQMLLAANRLVTVTEVICRFNYA